jgi:hypothetical protein
MTGYELLRRLKEIDGGSRAKFVGLSGFRAVDTPESVEFEKPVQREKLDAILASLYVDTPKIRWCCNQTRSTNHPMFGRHAGEAGIHMDLNFMDFGAR